MDGDNDVDNRMDDLLWWKFVFEIYMWLWPYLLINLKSGTITYASEHSSQWTLSSVKINRQKDTIEKENTI